MRKRAHRKSERVVAELPALSANGPVVAVLESGCRLERADQTELELRVLPGTWGRRLIHPAEVAGSFCSVALIGSHYLARGDCRPGGERFEVVKVPDSLLDSQDGRAT